MFYSTSDLMVTTVDSDNRKERSDFSCRLVDGFSFVRRAAVRVSEAKQDRQISSG